MSQKKLKLDKIDRRIISDLQDEGRMTNVDLANRAGISAPPCLRRVRALEDNGIITGYHATVNASRLGYGMTVFAQVALAKQAEDTLNQFAAMVNEWENVRECYIVTGDFDFLLKIVAKDWDDYQHFLTSELTAAPNVSSVRSFLTVKGTKYTPGVPVDVD